MLKFILGFVILACLASATGSRAAISENPCPRRLKMAGSADGLSDLFKEKLEAMEEGDSLYFKFFVSGVNENRALRRHLRELHAVVMAHSKTVEGGYFEIREKNLDVISNVLNYPGVHHADLVDHDVDALTKKNRSAEERFSLSTYYGAVFNEGVKSYPHRSHRMVWNQTPDRPGQVITLNLALEWPRPIFNQALAKINRWKGPVVLGEIQFDTFHHRGFIQITGEKTDLTRLIERIPEIDRVTIESPKVFVGQSQSF